MILGNWVSYNHLSARVLHMGEGERRSLEMSSPVVFGDGLDTEAHRHAYGDGFHRQLQTDILLPQLHETIAEDAVGEFEVARMEMGLGHGDIFFKSAWRW